MGSELVAFQDAEMRIVDREGEKWVTANELALALGYDDHRQLHKLINRHPEEFLNKTTVVNLTTVKNQALTLINYHGVLRAAMLAKTKQAVKFRDFAETVLYEAMTGRGALQRFERRFEAFQRQLEALERKIEHSVPALESIDNWPTPAQRARRIIGEVPAKRFNAGGSFDWHFNQVYERAHGGQLRMRLRRHIGKRPEFVVQPCQEMDDLLRFAYREYARNQKQLRLAIVK